MHGRTRVFVIIFSPIVFAPLLFFGKDIRCIYGIALLSAYWVAEVVPIGITSLMPLFLFPMLGVRDSDNISKNYFNNAPGAAGYDVVHVDSFFLSDTACTALMLPIAVAILATLADAKNISTSSRSSSTGSRTPEGNSMETTSARGTIAERLGMDLMSKVDRGFCKAMILACAHGSLIGGTTVITSTGPNLVFRRIVAEKYPGDKAMNVTYLEWISFAMPPLFLYLIASYIVLTATFMGPAALFAWVKADSEEDQEAQKNVETNIADNYNNLGPVSFAEKSVMSWFGFLVFLWIFRDPGFMSGWESFLPYENEFVSDSVPGILIACVMFIWPRDPFTDAGDPFEPILSWADMKTRFTWSCVLLIGAGYAISDAVMSSGLSVSISDSMSHVFRNLHSVTLQIVVTASIVVVTEFASNVSTGSIFIPIVLQIAETMKMHPLYLALPTTIACSFSFMLPMATPPNAIVYDTRVISVTDMALTGFFLNILCILITAINMNTWTQWLFELSTFPANLSVATNNSHH